jgi:dTDP-4-amino-4,6-dideoxygalactose transaminase
MNLKMDSRFKGIEPFKDKVWLSSPAMHGEELRYMTEAYESNWMSTVGENINELERLVSEYIGQWRNKM